MQMKIIISYIHLCRFEYFWHNSIKKEYWQGCPHKKAKLNKQTDQNSTNAKTELCNTHISTKLIASVSSLL